jgi:small subunit ribosomal protein S18
MNILSRIVVAAGQSRRPHAAVVPDYSREVVCRVGVVAAKSKRGKSGDTERPKTRTRSGPAQFKRKSCLLCKDHVRDVDYKNINLLRRYLSERGKIRSRRMSGACRRHQRLVATAIKRAREMALLPYVTANTGPPERQRSTGKR